MNKDERMKRFKIGIEYLQKTGLNLIMFMAFGKMEFSPGSAFEDIKKETLPTPYGLKKKDGTTYMLKDELRTRYKITTKVDLQRMLRICSILLTNFNGPEEQDFTKNHKERLKNWLKETKSPGEQSLITAFHTFDDILGQTKQLANSDYGNLAQILNLLYLLW